MKKTIRNKELLVGVIFLIVGVAYFALAFTIPSYDAYGGSSVVDSSFVPKVIGALMTVLSVLQLVFSLRAGKNPPPAAPSAKPTEEDGTFKVEDWDDDAANRNADTKALIAIFAILIVYMALMSHLRGPVPVCHDDAADTEAEAETACDCHPLCYRGHRCLLPVCVRSGYGPAGRYSRIRGGHHMLDLFIDGIAAIATPDTLALMILGVIVGIIFGSVPGLTAVTGIALFLPVTYSLGPIKGMALLMAIYIGAVSGGLIAAILINIPGTPASVATCFDGTPLARKGQAYKALGVGTVFSFLGTIFGILILVFVSPIIANFALKFGPAEYFSVSVFALTLIASLAGKSLIKGLISAALGIMFITVGAAPIDAVSRYTFGFSGLRGGFDILTVLVGLYAISEILSTAANKKALAAGSGQVMQFSGKGFGFTLKEFLSQKWNFLISALIGTGIGVLPGIGGATSNLLAYTVIKNKSKTPEKFGTGIIDGVVASESANNATIGGAMIPLLTLGIPGDAATAMLLGGLIVHGVQPGPLLFTTHPDVVYGVFAAMVVASILMILVQMFGLRLFAKVLKVPKYYLMPIIIVLCVVGAFALNNRLFDCWSIIFFGLVGYAMSKFDIPLAPMIMSFVLGETIETNLRRALMYSNGDISTFVTSPISCVFLVAAAISIVLTIRKQLNDRKKATA